MDTNSRGWFEFYAFWKNISLKNQEMKGWKTEEIYYWNTQTVWNQAGNNRFEGCETSGTVTGIQQADEYCLLYFRDQYTKAQKRDNHISIRTLCNYASYIRQVSS